jgi:hypothetical protein
MKNAAPERHCDILIGDAMTQPLDLSIRLVNFENRIQHFKQEAKTIASSDGYYSEEKFSAIKSEYAQFNTEKKSLKEEVQKTIQFVEEPFQTKIQEKFDSLKTSYKNLEEKLDSSYTTCATSRKLNALFDQCRDAAASKNNDSLKKMNEIKKRGLELISNTELTTAQLEKALKLQQSIDNYQIDNHQNVIISRHLGELYRLLGLSIDDPEKKDQFFELMKNIFYNDLATCALGREVQKEISIQLRNEVLKEWKLSTAYIPHFCLELNWKTIPVFKDLSKLSKILSEHALFNAPNDGETMDVDDIRPWR